MATIFTHAATGLPAIQAGGQERVLARLPTPKPVRGRFASFAATNPKIPRSDWKSFNRRPAMGDEYINDQQTTSGCVGWSSVQADMRCRALSGQTFQKLSGAYIYSWINGGRDNGSDIGSALTELMTHGTCLESEAGVDRIFRRDIPASADQTATRFKVDEGYQANDFDEFCTGILLGHIGVFPIEVGNNFYNLDSEDVVGYDRGGGNHAIHAYDLFQSQKWGWVLECANSWGLQWGNRGRFRVSERSFDGTDLDCYLIRASEFDPLDPNQPPVAR